MPRKSLLRYLLVLCSLGSSGCALFDHYHPPEEKPAAAMTAEEKEAKYINDLQRDLRAYAD